MVSTSLMVDTSSHPRAQLHRCVERSAYDLPDPRAQRAQVKVRKSRQISAKERRRRSDADSRASDEFTAAHAAAFADPRPGGDHYFQGEQVQHGVVGEMRRTVMGLRADAGDGARYPLPGLADLDDLLAEVRAAG